MSSNLQWQPLKQNWKDLSSDLKFAMRKRCHDPIDAILTSYDLLYLEGLRDAGIKDAQVLIEAIEKYDEIQVKENY
jgi:hypothetical protein